MAGLPGIATPGEVLSFWFQGDLDFNYKTKWFPSDDKDGVGQKAADKEITKRFASTLEAAVSGTLSVPWQEDSPETTLALVLVLDQFSRHVWRNDPDRDAKVSVTDSLAVQITISAIEKKWDQNLTPAKLVFLLMPFRHSQKTVRRLKDAINCLDEMLATHQKEHDLLQKFRKTTNRVLQDLEGKGFKDGDEILERREFEPTGDVLETMPNHPVYVSIFKFLTKVLLGVEDSELTAARRRPRPGKDRRNDGASGKVGRAARNEPQETEETQTDETFRQSEETPREAVVPSVGISLSGGVDSMVLAVVLKKISMDKQSPFGQFQVVAMHVDYANRPESAAEASFVEDWSTRMGISCVVTRIDFVKRGVTPREEYEVISRKARYDLYKECRDVHKFTGVFVGHHVGDVQENVIANVFRGAHLLSVNGMMPEGVVEGVRIWRPMLGNDKHQILDFAHTFGTPYFLDTTPTWSTRGKLRNQLQPLLAEMFGEGYLKNLTTLGQDSEQLSEIFENVTMKPFTDRLVSSDLGAYCDLNGFQQEPMLFWKSAMKTFCHGLGAGAMTEKSVRELIDRVTVHLGRQKLRDGWITLKKTNKTFVSGTVLGMFAEGVFPKWATNAKRVSSDPNKKPKDGANKDSVGTAGTSDNNGSSTSSTSVTTPPPPGFGQRVTLGSGFGEWGVTRCGPWTIEARLVSNAIEDDDETPSSSTSRLDASPQLDAFSILRNEITYFLPTSTDVTHVDTAGVSEENGELRCGGGGGRGVYIRHGARLPAFRGVDVAIVKVLPLPVVSVEGTPPDPADCVDAGLAENFAEEYKVKKWPIGFSDAANCIEIKMRFTRVKTRAE